MLKTITTLFMIFIVIAIIFFNTPLFCQSKGGAWQFENNGFDTADWDIVENNGELQNTAVFDSQAPLQEGSWYLWLDSANKYDFIKVNDSNDLDFDNENIGISAWIYPLAVGDDVHWILNKGDQFTNPKTTNYSLRISKSSNLEFLIRNSQNKAVPIASDFKIPKEQWTFIAVYYDYSAKKISMWNTPAVDPVQVLDFDQDYFSNNDPLSIGSWFSSEPSIPSVMDFEGRIDDVRISGRLEDILPQNTLINHTEHKPSLPIQLEIYPNPACLSRGDRLVTLHIQSSMHGNSTVAIYNVLGQLVYQIPLHTGSYKQHVQWDLKDLSGNLVNTGVYFARLTNVNKVATQKLVIIR
ncbi:MAG TPA: T9SS type A sorting domain-containing protein [bacterium]|nr:T9SS type A sorting domain-containing protein [bacterium]HPN43578.1 T9SS type A sorting domain-containing protein [bacterium]